MYIYVSLVFFVTALIIYKFLRFKRIKKEKIFNERIKKRYSDN